MASRKEEKEQRRQERLAKERETEQQSQRRRMYGVVVGAALLVAAIVAVVIVVASGGGKSEHKAAKAGASSKASDASGPPAAEITSLNAAAKTAGCVLQSPQIQGREHVPDSEKVKYNTSPPTSGSHNAVALDDGVYTKRPNMRKSLHALEHGRVVINYKPSIGKERISQLGGLFDEDSYHMLLLPNPGMPWAVAVVSWGHLAGCKKVTDATFDVIRDFRDRYRDTGPEQVP
jgi:hypothetical protein